MKTRTAAEEGLNSLSHYQPFHAERLARVFTENTLYCSNPADFNDPWDCRPCYSKSILEDAATRERVVQWFIDCGRRRGPSLPEAEHQRREQQLRGDRAFLERMIDQASEAIWDSVRAQYRVYCLVQRPDVPLMWAHYASKHQGLCLEFAVRSELFCAALPVTYCERYPEFDLADNGEDAALQCLLCKSDDWSYEQE